MLIRLTFIIFYANLLLTGAWAQPSMPSFEQLYQEAETLFYLENQTEETNAQALDRYLEVISICQEQDNQNAILADAYLKAGVIKLVSHQYTEAMKHYQASLKVLEQIKSSQDSAFFKVNVYLGDLNYLQETFDSAEYYYDKAQTIAHYWQEDLDEIERLYNSLGAMYFTLGNYKQSHNFFQKALAITHQKYPDNQEMRVYFKNNLAVASSKANNYDKAIEEYQDLLQYGVASYSLYNNLGRVYGKKGNVDSAVFYLKKATGSADISTQITSFNNLGRTYMEAQQSDTALSYFQRALSICAANSFSKNSDLAETYINIANTLEKQNSWQEALQYYQRAIVSLTYDFEDSTGSANPTEYRKVISLLHLFEIFQGKGRTFFQYYQQSQDIDRLKSALACYQDAINLAKYIQKSYDTDDAKLFFIEHIYPVFEEALAPVYALYQHTGEEQYAAAGLAIAEAGKASVLSEILKDLDIKTAGVVDARLINEEKRLKQKITSLRIKLAQSDDSVQNQAYQETITDMEIDLAQAVKALQKDEKYYRLKYQADSLNIRAIQRQAIGTDAAALEYVTSEDFLYIFLITEDEIALRRVALTPAFQEALTQVQAHLYHYREGERYKQQDAVALYRVLMQPYEEVLASVERLIIIPDGMLSYIPFEILSKDTAPDRYLIRDFTFNYAYSASLLLDAIQHRDVKLANTILAMAPFAGKDKGNIRSNGFNPLAASREEVEKIGGSIYLEDKATKRLFLSLAGSYGILHLATHASVDSENPLQSYIAFYPNQGESDAGYRLYTQELYNLKLDSVKLVILSACEAGGGQLVNGEGIISLARAFAYAGCPNIVTTLWKAADRSAAQITTSMHDYLREGYTKDEALRLAKIDYLNSDIHPLMKAPFYWANFIFIGDPAPIYTSYSFIWYIAIGVITVLGLLWVFRKKIRFTR